ncbi:MAG TPA: LemA family protein [Quisquiliibacterium sp.]|nr:LemA family protein [Quisquiliibacterium sp.]
MGIEQTLLAVASLVVALWAASAYNRLIALREHVVNAFAHIEVQLKRRFELIPNLVEVARKYLEHERSTLEAVTLARNQALHATRTAATRPGDLDAMESLSAASAQLTDALGRLMVVAEAYPELQADENMRQLSEEIASTENRVSFARQAYNDAVMDYNVGIGRFPANLIAAVFRFTPSRPLEAIEDPAERRAVRVQF